MARTIACCVLMATLLTAGPQEAISADRAELFANAVVAADHPLASQAGVQILKQGGNVVDAAVATSFALSVVRPASCGIGGGGFMVIWNADRQEAVALDYRERSPAKAHRRMYVESAEGDGANRLSSRRGALAVAVPGTVAGLCYALEEYGTLDLQTVLQPAVRLARDGFPLDEHAREVQRLALKQYAEHPAYRQRFETLYKLYLNDGVAWGPQARFHSPQLRVLELIAKQGREAFYRGPVAQAMVQDLSQRGGLLTLADLRAMKPVVRRPLRGEFAGFDILTMPPPSSGGTALLETLNILSAYRKQHAGEKSQQTGADSVHVFVEALKHAFADRAEYLGDADFAQVPIERLISPGYAAELARKIDVKHTKPPTAYGRFQPVDDAGTSHFSVIDRQGNAVACTETINTMFGSFVVEPTYGIVFNNEMDDFSAVPGEPNVFGLIQSEANAVEPGKKPLSSMTPTIVLEEGKAVHALGASGGPMIISATLQVLRYLVEADLPPDEAVARPRIHHQWLPNILFAEPSVFEQTTTLSDRGHVVEKRSGIAATQAVSRKADGLRGGSDPRKGGRPAGY